VTREWKLSQFQTTGGAKKCSSTANVGENAENNTLMTSVCGEATWDLPLQPIRGYAEIYCFIHRLKKASVSSLSGMQ